MSRCCSAEMKPGMSIPTGQPGTQRGFLQRRQRSASCSAPSRSRPSVTSSKLWMRASAGWCGMGARSGGMVLMFLGTRGPGGCGDRLRQMAGGGCLSVPFRSALQSGQPRRFVPEAFQGCLFFALEALLAQRQLVEVDQVAVEIGAIHAGELHLAADRDAARPAHSGAIHHDRVQADDVGMPNGRLTSLHAFIIGNRADGHDFADVLFVLQDLGQGVGDEALAAVAAVVGGDDQLRPQGLRDSRPGRNTAKRTEHQRSGGDRTHSHDEGVLRSHAPVRHPDDRQPELDHGGRHRHVRVVPGHRGRQDEVRLRRWRRFRRPSGQFRRAVAASEAVRAGRKGGPGTFPRTNRRSWRA